MRAFHEQGQRTEHDGETPGCRRSWIAATGTFVLLAVGFAGDVGLAQQDTRVLAHADTSSPQTTLKSFINACNEFYRISKTDRFFDRRSPLHRPVVRRVLECLDTSGIPDYAREDQASEAAVYLKEVLDRVPLPPFTEVSDLAEMEAEGPPEKVSSWSVPGTRITIARVEDGSRKDEYLFTRDTIERVADYYEEVAHVDYRTTGPEVSPGFYQWYSTAPGHPLMAVIVDWLPEWTRQRLFGLAYWQWAGLFFTLLASAFLMALAYRFQRSLARRWHDENVLLYGATILFSVLAALVPLGFQRVVQQGMTIRGTALYVADFSANFVALLAAIIVVFGLSNRVSAVIIASPRINPAGLNAQLIRIACKLTSIAAAVIIFLEGGHYLGIPVTTLLASAGVGGLAVALAAQDALKTLFGTIMLLADKPFRVGERIIIGKYDGVVEDIGLRSTRIRLLTGHQAHIPNDELARTDIENVGRRPHIKRTATIEMPASTAVAKVKRALQIVRTAVENHEGMEGDFPPRVYLSELNESSIGIVMIYWYHPANYWDYLALSEKVNLRIMEQLEAEGVPFAAPALTVHTPDEQMFGTNSAKFMENLRREENQHDSSGSSTAPNE